jgi:hypothetical protein
VKYLIQVGINIISFKVFIKCFDKGEQKVMTQQSIFTITTNHAVCDTRGKKLDVHLYDEGVLYSLTYLPICFQTTKLFGGNNAKSPLLLLLFTVDCVLSVLPITLVLTCVTRLLMRNTPSSLLDCLFVVLI